MFEMPKDPRFMNMTGLKYNRLTVVEYRGKQSWSHHQWLCKCDCGNTVVCLGENLRSGNTMSCGCFNIEVNRSKGRSNNLDINLSDNKLHGSYKEMIRRCSDKNSISYPRYGGRGISVCKRWVDDENAFFKDMGKRPDGTSLDRIDNNGDYSPSNCKWSTHAEQSQNTRETKLTSDLVRTMRQLKSEGVQMKKIWLDLAPNASYSGVVSAINGKSWKNIT